MGVEQRPPYSTPIVPEYEGKHTNLFAYPERGPWGNSRYPGNFSGKFVLDLVDIFKAKSVADPFAGGGTTAAVCKEFDIPFWSGDLRDGFNILEDAMPPCSNGTSPELVILHPPYFDLIHYSGKAWGEAPHPADLSAAHTLDEFIRMANEAQYAAYSHVKQGGHVAILIGSLRRQGKLYPLHRMLNLYGELVLDGIKVQFNTTTGRTKTYSTSNPLLVTEWVLALRKPQVWMVPVQVANTPKDFDMRRNGRQTWRSIVLSGLEATGGMASTEEIYNEIKSHSRAQAAINAGTDWQAIVRRELQEGPFRSISHGIWALV
jgi:hypothetical protein